MARLCVRIKPNPNPADARLDVMRTQAGDVVCIVDDGHVFSKAELNCGQYRFIDVPGVSQAELIALVAARYDAQENMIRVRNIALDDTILKSGAWTGKTSATKLQIDAITVLKA